MAAEHAAVEVDDLAAAHRTRLQPLDDVAVLALRDEADVLAVGLVGDGKAEFAGKRAGLLLRHLAEREPQERKLLGGRRVEKIALVPVGIGGAKKRAAPVGERRGLAT